MSRVKILILKTNKMIIEINTITGLIKIKQNEKEKIQKTAPNVRSPIQYNKLDIKRKYYNKNDPEYHRNDIWFSIQRKQSGLTKTTSKSLKFDKIVKQEPLLDLYY